MLDELPDDIRSANSGQEASMGRRPSGVISVMMNLPRFGGHPTIRGGRHHQQEDVKLAEWRGRSEAG